jgi:hypothetical protein
VSRRAAVPVVVFLTLLSLTACSEAPSNEIRCGQGSAGILAAQAVPSATWIPCITTFPVGWSYGGFSAETGTVRFWLDSDRAGGHAIQVELTRTCDTTGAVEAGDPGSLPAGVRRFELHISSEPRLSGLTFFTFAGGCVTFRYDLPGGAPTLLLQARQAVELFPREEIIALLGEEGALLCGAGAPPCVGETGA